MAAPDAAPLINAQLSDFPTMYGIVLDLIAQVENTVATINELVTPLYDYWLGVGAEASSALVEEWFTTARELVTDLNWVHDVLVTTEQNFAEAHRATLAGWGGA